MADGGAIEDVVKACDDLVVFIWGVIGFVKSSTDDDLRRCGIFSLLASVCLIVESTHSTSTRHRLQSNSWELAG